jgi:uncharacterized protein (TIGR02147 family)
LGIEAAKLETYKNQVHEESQGRRKTGAKTGSVHFKKRTSKEFHFVANWYYFAALEAMSLAEFKPETSWLKKTLQITESEASDCLKCLTRLGYLEVSPRGVLVKKISNSFVQNVATTEEMREVQKQFLSKSISTISSVPLEQRDHSGVTLTIARSQVPEAKELIRKFRRKFTNLMQKNTEHDSVYQLAISLFPLTD